MKTETSTHDSFPVFGLFFGFAASATLGILIGFVYLFSISPVAISTSAELTDIEGESSPITHFENKVRYYQKSSFQQNGQALVKKLYASTSNQIEISAFELNAWAAANLSSQSNFSSSGEKGDTPMFSFTPETPVFQIAEHQLHLAYPIEFEAWGKRLDFMFISSGDFKATDNGPDWNLQRLYINSAPLPFKQSIYQFAKPKVIEVLSKHEEAEKLLTALKMVKSVSVGEATLSILRE